MNDGKVQLSFTLPVEAGERTDKAALELARKMGLSDPMIAESIAIDERYTFFVIYGSIHHVVDYHSIPVQALQTTVMERTEIEAYIDRHIGRDVVVVGASTGTDAHTVGIDAIMNMKGFAGHYGLERYRNILTYNLGSQVTNEELIHKAMDVNADVILISQTVTQKDVHIQNLIHFVELLEAENLRDRFLIIVGGPRISHELAKELGFDAGFGPKKFAEDVASFFVEELHARTHHLK
jgi:beta-lysine 5,6-aminomutase beta subunit